MKKLYCALALLCTAVVCGQARAIALDQIVTLDIDNAWDIAFDNQGIAYITSGPDILRYDTQAMQYLAPWTIGGTLRGIDLSPDGQTFAVADGATDGTKNHIHLVDKSSGASTMVEFTRQSLESGTYVVAWAADGRLLVTSTFAGSGWVPLRRYTPGTQQVETLASVRQSTMLTPSADRQTIAYAESNSSGGPIGYYDATTGLVEPQPGTGYFMFEAAVSRDGAQFAFPTYFGTMLYDRDFNSLGTLGNYADDGPIGLVYSPHQDIVYTAWYDWSSNVPGLQAFNTDDFSQVDSWPIDEFGWIGNHAFDEGRIEISPDGKVVALTADGDKVYLVGVSDIPEPVSAALWLASCVLVTTRRRFTREFHMRA